MGEEFGRREPFVELKIDAAGAGGEAELAIGAVVVFPTAMGVGEEIIGELFDDIFERKLPHLDFGVVSGDGGIRNLHGREIDSCLPRPCRDAFNLAAVALAIEGDSDMGKADGSQGIKQPILVGWAQFAPRAACSACAPNTAAKSMVDGDIGAGRVGSTWVMGVSEEGERVGARRAPSCPGEAHKGPLPSSVSLGSCRDLQGARRKGAPEWIDEAGLQEIGTLP